jgi:hypothetical protein
VSPDSPSGEKRVFMRDLAVLLDRSSHTIRGWERDGLLPVDLVPHRNEKGWRYWTEPQARKIKAWMLKQGMQPGKGLSGFEPSEDQVREMYAKLRGPRDIDTVTCSICQRPVKNLAAHVRMSHTP